jgi:hypothetical protein
MVPTRRRRRAGPVSLPPSATDHAARGEEHHWAAQRWADHTRATLATPGTNASASASSEADRCRDAAAAMLSMAPANASSGQAVSTGSARSGVGRGIDDFYGACTAQRLGSSRTGYADSPRRCDPMPLHRARVELGRRRVASRASVVDQHVQATQVGLDRADHPPHRCVFRHIGLDGDCTSAQVSDGGRR